MHGNIGGEGQSRVISLNNSSQTVDLLYARGGAAYAIDLAIMNFGPTEIEIAYGNGDPGDFIPVASGQPFNTPGPVTKFVVRSSGVARVSYDAKMV